MEGVVFLAVRCFSCQTFQVNQKTKSGKWKCRMCGEGQSIVKVWGRGGHAKDVRGLVMDLNAAAGREDLSRGPSNVSRRTEQSRLHNGQTTRGESANQGGDRGFPQHGRHRQQQQHYAYTNGTGPGAHSLGFGFVSANLASGVDDATSIGSWDGRADEVGERGRGEMKQSWGGRRGWDGGCLRVEDASRRLANGSGMSNASGSRDGDRKQPDQPAWASQTGFQQARGASRWGVFASNRAMAMEGRGRFPGLGLQGREDFNFVTSIETESTARDGKRGTKRGPACSSLGVAQQPSQAAEKEMVSEDRWALDGDQQQEHQECSELHSCDDALAAAVAAGGGNHRQWKKKKTKRRKCYLSSSGIPHADEEESPREHALRGRGGGGHDLLGPDRGTVGEDHSHVFQEAKARVGNTIGGGGCGSDGGGGGMWGRRGINNFSGIGVNGGGSSSGGGRLSGPRQNDDGSARGPPISSTSRWSKFIQ
ncbi:unnamed protein product [Scytosiphon promiscuus]